MPSLTSFWLGHSGGGVTNFAPNVRTISDVVLFYQPICGCSTRLSRNNVMPLRAIHVVRRASMRVKVRSIPILF